MATIYRVEGSTHDANLTEGLAARVADPLWYLARQWQVGEFHGEDAATPVVVMAEVDSFPITEVWTPTDKTARRVDLQSEPLQTQIEKETPQLTLSQREGLQAGRRLLDLVEGTGDDKLYDDLRKRYAPRIKGSGLEAAQLRLLGKDSIDVTRLLVEAGKVKSVEDLEIIKELGGDPDHVAILSEWLRNEGDFAALQDQTRKPVWSDKSMDYRLRVATSGPEGQQIILTARDYSGGRLDWHHFDLDARPEELPQSNRQKLRVLASPLRFAGQPAARFWEMEDAAVYLADLAGGAADLARSVLGAYAAVAGDDWFHLTADIPNGHVAEIKKLVVRDCFGDETPVPAVSQRGGKDRVWRWFEHRAHRSVSPDLPPLLFVPPSLATTHRSPAFEEVHFRRDEIANLAWAIEKRHRGAMGQGVDAIKPPRPKPYTPENQDDWTFSVSSNVPDYWFPLVPVRFNKNSPQVVLRRGTVLHDPAQGKPLRAQTEILTSGKAFVIDEAEVPFSGARVIRNWRLARSMNGARHLWVGRRKTPSTGLVGESPWSVDALEGWARTAHHKDPE